MMKVWFGYRLHAIVDSVSKLLADYRVTTATDAKTGALGDMIDGLSGTALYPYPHSNDSQLAVAISRD